MYLFILIMAVIVLLSTRMVNHGLPKGVFSSSMAFVIGHWFFMVLNAWIVADGGGDYWARYMAERGGNFQSAVAIASIGLIFFTLGAFLAADRKPISQVYPLAAMRSLDRQLLLPVAAILLGIGFYAASVSFQQGLSVGVRARDPLFANLSYLVAPAVALSVLGAVEAARGKPVVRTIFVVAVVVSVMGVLMLWTRRPGLAVAFAVLVWLYAKRTGRLSGNLMYLMLPLVLLGAVGLYFFRLTSFYDLDAGYFGDVVTTYIDAMWLESAAFSALMFVVDSVDRLEQLWGGSFLFVLVFWIPRFIFPDKPTSFDLADDVGGLAYNLPASFYGEAIVNFGFIGVPLVAFAMGYLLKRLDVWYYSGRRTSMELLLYVIFAFNMFFLVRGAFGVVMSAAIIQALVPLFLLWSLKKFLAR